jgi:hypothetical protein
MLSTLKEVVPVAGGLFLLSANKASILAESVSWYLASFASGCVLSMAERLFRMFALSPIRAGFGEHACAFQGSYNEMHCGGI